MLQESLGSTPSQPRDKDERTLGGGHKARHGLLSGPSLAVSLK